MEHCKQLSGGSNSSKIQVVYNILAMYCFGAGPGPGREASVRYLGYRLRLYPCCVIAFAYENFQSSLF